MYTITISALKLNEILTAAKIMKCEYIYINEYGQTYGIVWQKIPVCYSNVHLRYPWDILPFQHEYLR